MYPVNSSGSQSVGLGSRTSNVDLELTIPIKARGGTGDGTKMLKSSNALYDRDKNAQISMLLFNSIEH